MAAVALRLDAMKEGIEIIINNLKGELHDVLPDANTHWRMAENVALSKIIKKGSDAITNSIKN